MRMLRYGIAVGLLASLGACSDMMGGNKAPHPAAITQPTMAPDMIRQVQSTLRDGGYYKTGSVDGVWGSGTESAVRSFQQDHNLGSSGQLDVPTLHALNLVGGSTATNNAVGLPTTTNDTTPTQPMSASPTAPMNTTTPNPPANTPAAPATR